MNKSIEYHLLELNSPEIREYEVALFHFFQFRRLTRMALFSESERRKQIREEIKRTSREEFILNEMIRLGFWPRDAEKPQISKADRKKRKALRDEINELSRKYKKFQDEEAALQQHKKERMRRSREKQKVNKQKREKERLAKQAAWKEKQAKDIIYLGKKYSAGLKNKTNDAALLTKNNLPTIRYVGDLAKLLETQVSELRYLSYYRSISKISHYIQYAIPKKSGGVRNISAPLPRLKYVQRAILDKLLLKVKISEYAHGFAPDRSIVSNATPHLRADLVVNMDLKDFFSTLSYKRIWGMFRKLGFSDQIATILSLICTQPIEEKIKIDDQFFYVNNGERVLPQGAPSSPAITNIICRRLDQRMAGIGRKLGFTYTRYADDMTFSGPESSRRNLQKLLWQTKAVIRNEDFNIHPAKTRIMSKGNRQEVTGVVVNEKAGIPRKKIRAFRALLHQIEKDGPEGKKWGESPDLLASIHGFARYIYMVDPGKGKKYLAQVDAINRRYASKKSRRRRTSGDRDRPWWKFW